MKTIEIPEKDLIISEDWKHYARYPYSSYLYIFNMVCMYKAGVISKDKVREKIKNSTIVSLDMLDNTEDIQTIVLSFMQDEIN